MRSRIIVGALLAIGSSNLALAAQAPANTDNRLCFEITNATQTGFRMVLLNSLHWGRRGC